MAEEIKLVDHYNDLITYQLDEDTESSWYVVRLRPKQVEGVLIWSEVERLSASSANRKYITDLAEKIAYELCLLFHWEPVAGERVDAYTY